MTRDLFTEFPGQSKEEWIEQVIKERKGRAYEELNHRWGDDVEMEPFYHPDDKPSELDPVGRASGSPRWNIGQWIELNHGSDWKAFLDDAMENDVQSLFLNATSTNMDALSAHQETLQSESIELHFRCSSNDQANHFIQTFEDYEGTINVSIDEDETLIFEAWKNASIDSSSNALFTLQMPSKDDPVSSMKHVLSTWLSLIEHTANDNLRTSLAGETHFIVEIGPHFLLEIAKVRALKIVWLNLLKSKELPLSYPRISANVSRSLYGNDPQINHIKATVSAMAAVLGGADTVLVQSIHGTDEDPSVFSHRMSRNILHILKLESFFDSVQDPVSGSFYIDELTTRLANNCWKKL